MRKIRTFNTKKPPKGWDLIEPQLLELQLRMREIEKDPSEAENNSRRKTITKYIEDNKLLISYQRKI